MQVIAKGEAQGMVGKFVGITLGISLASWIQSSTSLTLLSFGAVTWFHMFCNLKSYQSIQLRTLNPYRASLVFSEYLLSGLVPPFKEVNDEEPLLPVLPVLDVKLSNRVRYNFFYLMKRLRSLSEAALFLEENPEFRHLSVADFSFTSPKIVEDTIPDCVERKGSSVKDLVLG
ncbi:hypothetical protein LIER_06317 [Lithospermum erythrorhizon]|uniref:Protein root UVB sensitive/RUS domain-containing protein n=1 Tax=Lithospermum erythrorhizon TaxID=34254 RepID=A0AAV3P530_LITER